MLTNSIRIRLVFASAQSWDTALTDLCSAVRVYVVRLVERSDRGSETTAVANTVCQLVMRVDGGHIGLCDAIDLAAVVQCSIPRMIDEAVANVNRLRGEIDALGGITRSHPLLSEYAAAKRRLGELRARIARLEEFRDVVAAVAQDVVAQMLV